MRAMLLCAGLSTRLGELGADGRSRCCRCADAIVEFGIANLVAHGITGWSSIRTTVPSCSSRQLGDGRRFGARIRYIHEPVILGTGGGLKHALPLLDPDGRDEPFVLDQRQADLRSRCHGVARRVSRRRADPRHDGRASRARREGVGRGRGRRRWAHHEHPRRRRAHVLRSSRHAAVGDGATARRRVRLDPPGYLPWLRAGEPVLAYEHEHGYFAEHSTPGVTSTRTGRCSAASRCAIHRAGSSASIRPRGSTRGPRSSSRCGSPLER